MSHYVFMTTQVAVAETDDPYFIALLNSLVHGLITRIAPAQLWIIQIDNWFDHKWLRFPRSGTVNSHVSPFMNRYDAARQEAYQDNVGFPPFTPNRVLGQWSFVRTGDQYNEVPLPATPHRYQWQPSEENRQRRVRSFSCSACFVWYSANTVANGKGSVMVYSVVDDRVDSWFASFDRRQEYWNLGATKGVNRDFVRELLSTTETR